MLKSLRRLPALPRKIRTLTRMEPEQRRLALEAWMLIWRTTVQHRFQSYAAWQGALSRALKKPPTQVEKLDIDLLSRLLRAYRTGLRGQPFRPNCLQRSRALWRLLRRYGIASRIVIGTRLEEGRLLGHAWVERDGRVLNDSPAVAKTYTPFTPPGTDKLNLPFD